MPSQIKVDEIKNVAGQYEIKTDTFKGQTTAGSISVQGEGTVTTNLQQGLAKNWNNVAGDGTSFNDSFNTSSLTDNSTGVHTVNYTSNMVNNRASLTACHQYTTASGTGAFLQNSSTRTTSSHRHDHYENGSSADPAVYNTTLHGDLA